MVLAIPVSASGERMPQELMLHLMAFLITMQKARNIFVDLPDFSSSTGSIQIQRGVGTSSNGAGAFGGSINFSTNEVNKDAYVEFNNSFGSFNTWKNTVKAGTGLINGFTTDIRLSRIKSDGFIDRATSDLSSFHFTSAYIAKNHLSE